MTFDLPSERLLALAAKRGSTILSAAGRDLFTEAFEIGAGVVDEP